MNGFITESTSKITDGFGTTIKLLALYFLSSALVSLSNLLLGNTGMIISGILLLFVGAYFLYKMISGNKEESTILWIGMAAAILLWKGASILHPFTLWKPLTQYGVLIWVLLVLFTALFWKLIKNQAVRLFLITFIFHWLGRIMSQTTGIFAPFSRFVIDASLYFRILGIVGILFSIWWIVSISKTIVERKYAALTLYFCFLIVFVLF